MDRQPGAAAPLASVVVGGMSMDPLLLWVVAPALRRIFLSHDTSPASVSGPATGGGAAVTEVGIERVLVGLVRNSAV